MDESILDTDILSEVLKRKDLSVLANAGRYLGEHQHFAFSEMTVYEISRGLKAVGATQQLLVFLKIVGASDVLPVSRSVLEKAADLWVEGRSRGLPHEDADLIIAATALEYRRVLVTGNTPHYSWIKNLEISDWRTT